MRIGYSFWGFLGAGVTDTPDGGRSHRRTLVGGLRGLGHDLVFLQANRDLTETGHDLTRTFTWDDSFPDVDVLFLEWRWPIPGRTDIPCGSPRHCCDLHRQDELVRHYTMQRGVPTVVWDKDQQLGCDSLLMQLPHVRICEPALFPAPGRTRLLIPVADAALENADPQHLAGLPRDIPLIYVGNQYDRDDAFDSFFASAAAHVPHLVAGKWPGTGRWPHVAFTGRVPFTDVEALHRRALATVLLAPDRYATRGQFTQRTFESVLAGCLPLGPAVLRGVETIVPPGLIVRDGAEVTDRITMLTQIAGTSDHAALIARCIAGLDPFRVSRQLRALTAVFDSLCPHAIRS
jgi:hypothetical protein